MSTLSIDDDKCILCGACTEICPSQNLSLSEGTIIFKGAESCMVCGHCKAVCPEGAIDIPSLNADEFIPIDEKREHVSPDNLLMLLRSRRSIRRYMDKALEFDKVDKIVESGRYAPSSGNLQALKYNIVTSAPKLSEIRKIAIATLSDIAGMLEFEVSQKIEANNMTPIDYLKNNYAKTFRDMADQYSKGIDRLLWNAPALFIIHVSKLIESPGVDAGIAAMQMVLMAETLGLGTCFIGYIPLAAQMSAELKKALEVPDNNQIVASFIAGYSDASFLTLISRKKPKVQRL